MDHFNYFVSINALGKVLIKIGLKVIAVFFLSFAFKYMHTNFIKYEKKPFRIECLCYQP